MAIGSAYLNARARALVGQIVPTEAIARLAEYPSEAEIVRALEARGWFRHPNGVVATVDRLDAELDGDYRDAMMVIGGAGRRLVRAMYGRIEAAYIKAVLGCAWRGIPPAERPRLIGAAHLFDRSREEALIGAMTLEDAIRRTPSPYGSVLENSVHRVAEVNSLFPLESALDLQVLHEMWLAGRALDGTERRLTGRLLGAWFDTFNISAAARLRIVYGVRPDEALGYLIHHGEALRLSHRRALAAAEGMSGIVAALRGTPYVDVLEGVTEPREIERKLAAHFRDVVRDTLSGSPFHLGVTIGYLFLKEMEVRNLARIVEARRRGIEPQVASRLVL